jgi:O-acetylserine/cysteine efflux transporter
MASNIGVLYKRGFRDSALSPISNSVMTTAFAGLTLIGLTLGADVKLAGLGLALAGAFSWAVGNVLVKRTSNISMFPLVVWASLIPPLPAMLVSSAYDPRVSLVEAIFSASWLSLGAVVYLGTIATTLAYATWGKLLQRYSTAVVAPFALLAPCTGAGSA